MRTNNIIGPGNALYKKIASPVSSNEFRNTLYSLLRDPTDLKRTRLGIAVSGGADSMALAILCRELALTDNLPTPYAFVVDHRARERSSQEGQWVCSMLEKAGLHAQLLTLVWPDNVGKGAFETQARALRYQALGRACHKSQTPLLLMGHHKHDVYETLLCRILRHNQRMTPMEPVKQIPECDGIHGVHESGQLGWNFIPSDKKRIPIEAGGVQVLRPLLNFAKDSLVATCVSQNMQWVEDPSNQDRTLTERNALRYLVKNYRMPAALQEHSILMSAGGMCNQRCSRDQLARSFFNSTTLALDVRSGLLRVELPRHKSQDGSGGGLSGDPRAVAVFVEKLARLVTPNKSLNMVKLSKIVEAIDSTLTESKGSEVSLPTFNTFHASAQGLNFCLSDPTRNEWTISCQNRLPTGVRISKFPTKPDLHNAPRSHWRAYSNIIDIPEINDTSAFEEAQFQLFNNLFWIRVHNPTRLKVRIRHPTVPDFQALRRSLEPPLHKMFQKALHEAAPGHVRHTLPLIEIWSDQHAGQVLALPTFMIRVEVNMKRLDLNVVNQFRRVRWEVRYRKINLYGHKPGDVLIGGYVSGGPDLASEGCR